MLKPVELLMIPGPTPVAASIAAQMARPVAAYNDPEFLHNLRTLGKELGELWHQDPEGQTFVLAGSGTLGMDMAIENTTKAGDSVLVVSNGLFGDRMTKICKRKGLDVDVLAADRWGTSVTPEQLAEKMKGKKYSVVCVTHVETSTGVEAPLKAFGEVLKNYPDTLYIVDGIAATAGAAEYMTDWHIDVVIGCSQKSFGVAPGLLILWASKRALDRRNSLGELIHEGFADFNEWLPVMREEGKYFATPPVTMIWALCESLRLIKEEGLEERYDRHVRQAKIIDQAMEKLGFTQLADEAYRAPTLSVYGYPEGVDDAAFRAAMAQEGVTVAGSLGDWGGKSFRLGHMGNIDAHTITATLGAVARACIKLGKGEHVGCAMATLLKGLAEEKSLTK